MNDRLAKTRPIAPLLLEPDWSVLDVLADDTAAPSSAALVAATIFRPSARRRLVILRLRGSFDLARWLPAPDPNDDCTICGAEWTDRHWCAGRLDAVVVTPVGEVRAAWVRAIREACDRARIPFFFVSGEPALALAEVA